MAGTAPSRSVRAIAALLLTIFVAQASIAARLDSVTVDEFVGLPVGLYTLLTGDTSPATMNPPFFRAYEALPVLFLGPSVDRRREVNHWELGYEFMEANREAYQAVFVLARLAVVLAAALLGALVFRWACELYGPASGLVALFLFSFSPALLSHGHLVTLDLAGALGFAITLHRLWRFLDRPTYRSALLLGTLLGLAPLLKISNITLLPVVGIILMIHLAERARREGAAGVEGWIKTSMIIAVMAILFINVAYGFDRDICPPGETLPPENRRFYALDPYLPGLRLVFPVPFLKAVDLVLNGDHPSEPTYFLAGNLSATGWWYYHLAAFGLKTPLPLLLAAIFTFGLWCLGRRRHAREYCLFVPIAWVFAANAVGNPLDIGERHTLSAMPLWLIVVSPTLAAPLRALRHRGEPRKVFAGVLSALALVWFCAESLSVAPRYLEYFNELAGGPRRGHRWLIDSNLDWGQDLVRLAEYLKERHLGSVHLAYFGRVDPTVYGIRFEPVEEGNTGITVVSASFLMGRPYSYWESPGQLAWAKSGAFTWLQHHRPVDRVGSMFVFDLSRSSSSSDDTSFETPPPR